MQQGDKVRLRGENKDGVIIRVEERKFPNSLIKELIYVVRVGSEDLERHEYQLRKV